MVQLYKNWRVWKIFDMRNVFSKWYPFDWYIPYMLLPGKILMFWFFYWLHVNWLIINWFKSMVDKSNSVCISKWQILNVWLNQLIKWHRLLYLDSIIKQRLRVLLWLLGLLRISWIIFSVVGVVVSAKLLWNWAFSSVHCFARCLWTIVWDD